jgi:hypothetical protein
MSAVREVVRPRRFELLTYSFGGCRSIQLSYGRLIGKQKMLAPAIHQTRRLVGLREAESISPIQDIRESRGEASEPAVVVAKRRARRR